MNRPSKLSCFAGLVLLAWPVSSWSQGPLEFVTPTPLDGEGRRLAILIGVDSYADPDLAPLQFAAKDAADLAAVLEHPVMGDFDSVRVLGPSERTATRILLELRRWKDTIGSRDTVVIYFSGHGMRWLDERGRSRIFLAASNTVRSDPLNTAVPLEAIQDFLTTLPAARRVLIVDACFTGDGKVDESDAGGAARAFLDEKLPLQIKNSEKEAQLFSTTYGRPALESKSMENGVYTGNFVAALGERFEEADMDGDLVVTVSEAHDYARDRTMKRTKGLQIPMVFYKVVGQEEVVLSGDPKSRRRVELAMVSAYDGAQAGLRMFVDGEERGTFPRSLLVVPGQHTVEFRSLSGKLIDRGRFDFGKRGVYSVSSIRDSLGGGRHLFAVSFLHAWIPGAGIATATVPTSSGVRISYGFRFPSRSPLIRKLGLGVDVSAGFMPGQTTPDPALPDVPATTVLDLGFGPMMRLDLPYVLLSLRPRVALTVLARNETRLPFVNWVFGSVGVEGGVSVRPINRLSIQLLYNPMLFNAALQGEAKTELMHRLSAGVELGF